MVVVTQDISGFQDVRIVSLDAEMRSLELLRYVICCFAFPNGPASRVGFSHYTARKLTSASNRTSTPLSVRKSRYKHLFSRVKFRVIDVAPESEIVSSFIRGSDEARTR